MSYCGIPAWSISICTVPVGYGTFSMCWLRPLEVKFSIISFPRESSPIALTTQLGSPNCDTWKAKFAGAPPIFLPVGRTSQRASPIPIMRLSMINIRFYVGL